MTEVGIVIGTQALSIVGLYFALCKANARK